MSEQKAKYSKSMRVDEQVAILEKEVSQSISKVIEDNPMSITSNAVVLALINVSKSFAEAEIGRSETD